MIRSFRSKALKLYFDKKDASKLQPHHIRRIRNILTLLDTAMVLQDVNLPGYKFHGLQPPGSNTYSLWVNGNYRIVFRFEGTDVFDVDYLDYH